MTSPTLSHLTPVAAGPGGAQRKALALATVLQDRGQKATVRDSAADLTQSAVETREALEEIAAAAAEAAAHALTMAAVLEQAMAALTDDLPPEALPPASPGTAWPELSPREREVLTLVSQGHTNKAIAAQLFVSPNTVKSHVSSLMSKMQATSRAQLAAIAARDGAR